MQGAVCWATRFLCCVGNVGNSSRALYALPGYRSWDLRLEGFIGNGLDSKIGHRLIGGSQSGLSVWSERFP